MEKPDITHLLRADLIDALRRSGHLPEDEIEAKADQLMALAEREGERIRLLSEERK